MIYFLQDIYLPTLFLHHQELFGTRCFLQAIFAEVCVRSYSNHGPCFLNWDLFQEWPINLLISKIALNKYCSCNTCGVFVAKSPILITKVYLSNSNAAVCDAIIYFIGIILVESLLSSCICSFRMIITFICEIEVLCTKKTQHNSL